jgi:hypothetical protein
MVCAGRCCCGHPLAEGSSRAHSSGGSNTEAAGMPPVCAEQAGTGAGPAQEGTEEAAGGEHCRVWLVTMLTKKLANELNLPGYWNADSACDSTCIWCVDRGLPATCSRYFVVCRTQAESTGVQAVVFRPELCF